MSLLRTASALRSLPFVSARRHLAIAPTVKSAPDTSALDFPAPSHVSLSAEASEIARQLTAFYADPDSTVKLSEEQRQSLHDEIAKRVKTIPNSTLDDDWVNRNIKVPANIRMGDNPYFEVYKMEREEGKGA